MVGVVTLAFIAVAAIASVTNSESPFGNWPDTCVKGLDKDSPSAETEDLLACKQWQSLSCCLNYAHLIHENGSYIVNFLTSVCGPMSDECKQYILHDECFFFCEPMLGHYGREDRNYSVHAAPICGSYCDDWFEACKDDKTCVGDWLNGILLAPDSPHCPANGSTCTTFREIYGNGKGLCETIFSVEYVYEESNTNCMVMNFEGENPNLHGNPYGKNSANKVTCSTVVYVFGLLLFTFCL